MLSWKSKSVLALTAVATLAASAPREADAFIFRWWHARRAERIAYRTALYAPSACCQPACTACQPVCPTPCPQQVCSYQPETCYRTVVQQVPVTVYRPVTTVDPCTGCPRTTMQACTTMTTQTQRVPYTTYRQVCQMVQPACNTCASPVVAQPVVQMQAQPMVVQQQIAAPAIPATPGCASCGVPSVAPAAPTYAPQQFQPGPTTELAPQQPSTSLQTVPADQAPTLPQGQSSYYQGPTFPSTSQYPTTSNYSPVTAAPLTSSGLYPVPSTTPSTGTSYQPRVPAATTPAIRPLPDLDREEPAAPGLLNPQDRTATRELPASGTIAPISWASAKVAVVAPAAATQQAALDVKKWDDSGWRPAR